MKRPLAPATVQRKLSVLSSFYRHAVDSPVPSDPPSLGVARPKVSPDSPTVGFDRAEMRWLRTAAVTGFREQTRQERRYGVQFPEHCWRAAMVRVRERIEAGRRQRGVLGRVSRAAWRLDQAERERRWALASAHAEGISIRALATAAGLSPPRVHQLLAAADLDVLDAALGALRAAGWPRKIPAPMRTPNSTVGDNIADRLSDEVDWLRRCADWLTRLDADGYPPVVNLRCHESGPLAGRRSIARRSRVDQVDQVDQASRDCSPCPM